jgi:hypothetical protein
MHVNKDRKTLSFETLESRNLLVANSLLHITFASSLKTLLNPTNFGTRPPVVVGSNGSSAGLITNSSVNIGAGCLDISGTTTTGSVITVINGTTTKVNIVHGNIGSVPTTGGCIISTSTPITVAGGTINVNGNINIIGNAPTGATGTLTINGSDSSTKSSANSSGCITTNSAISTTTGSCVTLNGAAQNIKSAGGTLALSNTSNTPAT